MNKKKIIILSVVFLSIVFLILDFLSYRVDKIVKNLIIDQGNQALGQQVSVGKIDTSILSSSIKINNIEIKNLDGFKNKNIIQIKNIDANFVLTSLFKDTIIIKDINIDGATLYYEVLINNKEVKDNVSSFKPALKNPAGSSAKEIEVSKELESKNQSKKKNKDFLINQLTINNAKINASSEFLDINKDITLNKMSFNNVGTAEKSTKFKEVLQMVFANVLLNINNEVIQGDLKNKIKDKVKNLKNKISPESLKKLEKTFR
ncbi:AsmA [Candidatus Pelagibacterales bacterium]